ncbi:hypothetical protein [Nisaea denitrificans]|uniref:F0F1 ATP synthase subunit B family protein n=1 Tax=Nisaea denitrificans TaxID=390877 RepID=UPI000408BCBC|nr:hypothetical protein [Nisaea denitrificans]
MSFDWWTFGLQTVNFVILVWLLHRFLYKPVLRFVDARRADIDKEHAEAKRIQQEAQSELKRIHTARSETEAEREAVLAAARTEAEIQAAARLAQAEHDAEELETQARKSLQAERDAAAGETRKIALDLGMDVARRLLQEVPADLRMATWLDRIENHLNALEPGKRDALLVGPASTGRLRVIGAIPLPKASMERWRERLIAILGDDLEIEFAHDPDLIAGVELHFPGAILHFSWRGTLNAMRVEMTADADAR